MVSPSSSAPLRIAGAMWGRCRAPVKIWWLRYVAATGEHRRQPLGRYPDVTLARARLLARKAKRQVAEKIDVVGEEQKAKADAERQKLERLNVLAENYFADCARGTRKPRARAKAPRSIKEERNYWERDIKPAFGLRPRSRNFAKRANRLC